MHQIILASESPRRRQLLQEAGISFTAVPVKVSEIPNKNLNVNEQILDIARRKSLSVFTALKSSLPGPFIVLSADTEVIFGNQPLGKPSDEEDAFRILRLLSGKIHEVKTAVVLLESSTGLEVSQVETTSVHFKDLSDFEIRDYIKSGEPMDKAGAYAIQGLGRQFVKEFVGSYDNVVGLPVTHVKDLLSQIKARTQK